MRNFFFSAFILSMSTLCALPVGNPSEPSLLYRPFYYADDGCYYECDRSCFQWGVGFYGDYVFNRHMETVNGRDIDTTKIFTNAAYLVANLYERVDVFATLGTSRLSLNTSLGAFNPTDPHPLFEVESGTAFSYSVGGRATLFEWDCVSWGIEGQYFATRPNIKRLYIASGAVSYPTDAIITDYSEWQVGSGVSYRYNEFFVPYIALKYARSFWKFKDGERFIIEDNTGTFLYNMRNDRRWGYAVGLTCCPLVCEELNVTVEARFLDETALYVNAEARF